MTVVERLSANTPSLSIAQAPAKSRDGVIDAMRGIAILMVIGIHSLPQPLEAVWENHSTRRCDPACRFSCSYQGI